MSNILSLGAWGFSVGKATELNVVEFSDETLALAMEDPNPQGGLPTPHARVKK